MFGLLQTLTLVVFLDSCDASLFAIEQVQSISTPGYPQQYSSNLTCTWTVTANKDYLVRLETGFVSNDTCCEHLEVFCFSLGP